MRKYLLFICAILTFNVYGQLRTGEQSKVDELFKPWNNRLSPGAALGIVRDGKLVFSRGYGMADLEHDVAINDSTIFYIGSVSKQFVTMCLLLLEEQGKLSLDDRVQKYLPDFPEYNAPLTIRHFIHHTSGVRDNLTLWELAGNNVLDQIDKEEMYQLIRRQKELNFTPGEQYLYSNSCYFMLGLIIEKISGESLREFAHKNIFAPLGMYNTFIGDDNTRIIKNRAFSYQKSEDGFKNQIMRYDLVGSGGIYSNITDLYLWDQNFYHNKLGKGSQALIEKMHTEGMLNNGKSSGYAFAVINGTYRGLRTVSHSGALAGYRSFFLRFPEQKVSVIILGNVTPLGIPKLPYDVADILLEKQLTPLVPVKSTTALPNTIKEKKESPVEDAKQYLGSFYSEELDVTYHVTEKNNQLYCSIKSKQPVALLPQSHDLFTMGDVLRLNFERNNQNQITGFSVDAGRVTNLK
ncbi:MAG: class A beta-lactamase-related serine hydrolase, partial [Chitinophagaceae bacterium]